MVQYGSSFAVHDSLKESFKGRFTTISPAAVEIHVSWDIPNSQSESISVSADSVAEYDFLPHASSLKDNLFMADRGYFKLSYLKTYWLLAVSLYWSAILVFTGTAPHREISLMS
jgi:hypothetical protein